LLDGRQFGVGTNDVVANARRERLHRVGGLARIDEALAVAEFAEASQGGLKTLLGAAYFAFRIPQRVAPRACRQLVYKALR
jgi:hypothetical protein